MRASCLAIVIVLAPAASAQDTPRAIVEKAIQAQGGADKVAKLRTMRIKAEGTTNLVPGQADLPFTVEDVWRMPDRYKSTTTITLAGMPLTQALALVGDTGWIQFNNQTQDLPKPALDEAREQKYAEDFDRLGFLDDKSVELSAIGEAQVDGKPALGVLLKSKGHREVKLYFDKASGLLVKRAHPVVSPATGMESMQEVVFGDYQEKDGVKHYRKLTAYRDGKKVIDVKVKEIELLDKVDDKVFAKP